MQTLNGESSEPSDELRITIDTANPEIEGMINPQTVVLGSTATVSDLSQYFSDSTTLSYAGSSESAAIATATVTEGAPGVENLDIRSVSVGSTIVRITATDLADNETTRTIDVTVIPPSLEAGPER